MTRAEVFLLVGWIAGIAFALFVPGWLKRRHGHRQDALIHHCRALYIHAVQAIALGDRATAQRAADHIRRIEARWSFGNSLRYKTGLASTALLIGFLGNLVLRFGAVVLPAIESGGFQQALDGLRWSDLTLLAAISSSGASYSLISYIGILGSDWLVDDCGDRLEKLLQARKAVAVSPKQRRGIDDGLNAREVLGLPTGFTQAQLDVARRRLAAQYHPDKWSAADATSRLAAEAAMKRVNAAYDVLKRR